MPMDWTRVTRPRKRQLAVRKQRPDRNMNCLVELDKRPQTYQSSLVNGSWPSEGKTLPGNN